MAAGEQRTETHEKSPVGPSDGQHPGDAGTPAPAITQDDFMARWSEWARRQMFGDWSP